MIIVDTNVISEPLRPNADPRVSRWLDRQPVGTLYLTTVNLGELLYGLELLPAGRRKEDLMRDLQTLLREEFANRLLSYDEDAAKKFAKAAASARSKGLSVATADGQIAAIALSRSFSVATRDTSPFKAMGVETIDPWAS